MKFLDGIVTGFGTHSTIISDNAKSFVGTHIFSWVVDHGIYLTASSNYHPKENGLAKSSNRNLIKIMRRIIEDKKRCWHSKLRTTLWANKITSKRVIQNSSFMLFYGREEMLPISLEFPSLELAHQLELVEDDAMTVRMA